MGSFIETIPLLRWVIGVFAERHGARRRAQASQDAQLRERLATFSAASLNVFRAARLWASVAVGVRWWNAATRLRTARQLHIPSTINASFQALMKTHRGLLVVAEPPIAAATDTLLDILADAWDLSRGDPDWKQLEQRLRAAHVDLFEAANQQLSERLGAVPWLNGSYSYPIETAESTMGRTAFQAST